MNKVMIFIDGTWLYRTQSVLAKEFGEDYRIDYEKLPIVLGKVLAKQMGRESIDIVRVYFFCSIPVNYDPLDVAAIEKQQNFYDTLKEDFHYEVECYPIDFCNRRLRRADRLAADPNDDFQPEEKCVDIALATHMLYYAAIPYAYDIAVAVVGDEDFRPVLQHVRRLGRRVAIGTIRSQALAFQYRDPLDAARIRDFDTIFLNDHLADVQLKAERRQVECAGRNHKGSRLVWTDLRLRPDRPFYCPKCVEQFQAERVKLQAELAVQLGGLPKLDPSVFGTSVPGVVKRLVTDKTIGFISVESGKEYYFHESELDGVRYEDLKEKDIVVFEIAAEPTGGKRAGAARRVRLYAEQPAKVV